MVDVTGTDTDRGQTGRQADRRGRRGRPGKGRPDAGGTRVAAGERRRTGCPPTYGLDVGVGAGLAHERRQVVPEVGRERPSAVARGWRATIAVAVQI